MKSLLSDSYLYHPDSGEYFYVSYVPENADYLRNTPIEPSFTEIQQWIMDNYGFKVGSMYVSEVKRDHGIQALGNFVYPCPDATKHFKCPPEKRTAIEAALRHFGMI